MHADRDTDGNVRPLDRPTFAEVQNVKDQWSAAGKRVILLAAKSSRPYSNFDSTNSRRVMNHARAGLTRRFGCIVDPPRDEIPEVIKNSADGWDSDLHG